MLDIARAFLMPCYAAPERPPARGDYISGLISAMMFVKGAAFRGSPNQVYWRLFRFCLMSARFPRRDDARSSCSRERATAREEQPAFRAMRAVYTETPLARCAHGEERYA